MRRAKPGATTLSGARRTAAKISDTDRLVKVGKITASVAKAIKARNLTIAKHMDIVAGDIMLSDGAIKHIMSRHNSQIRQLGLTAEEYAMHIIAHFNQIFCGHDDRLLLVVNENKPHHDTAVIELRYSKKGYWRVVTANPREAAFFKKKNLLYEKKEKKNI